MDEETLQDISILPETIRLTDIIPGTLLLIF